MGNIEELRALVGSAGDCVDLSGHTNVGDGGHGRFYWRTGSTDADNNGTIIKATASAAGRWIRLYSGALNIQWFGAQRGGDIASALSQAISAAEDIYGSQTIAWVNTLAGTEVIIPAGYWTLGSRVTIKQGGIHIKGEGAAATVVTCTTSSGAIEIIHDDHLDGQSINNVAITDLQLIGTATTTSSTDIGISATIARFFRVQNVKLLNFSVMMDLIACEEPVVISDSFFWQNNLSLTGASSIRILAKAVNSGTVNTHIDPDTSVEYYKSSMIFMSDNEFRAADGVTKRHLLVQGIDGLYANNCHLLGATNQVEFDPISSAVPITNTVFSDVFFDGRQSATDRNIYVAGKGFTSEMGTYILNFNDCTLSGARVENVKLGHEDLRECVFNNGVMRIMPGNYMLNAQYGKRLLELNDVRFILGSGGPDFGAIVMDTRNSSFFDITRIKGCLFYHDESTTPLPKRHIIIQGDGSNSAYIAISENDYMTSEVLTDGFIDDNSSPSITILDRNNTAYEQ